MLHTVDLRRCFATFSCHNVFVSICTVGDEITRIWQACPRADCVSKPAMTVTYCSPSKLYSKIFGKQVLKYLSRPCVISCKNPYKTRVQTLSRTELGPANLLLFVVHSIGAASAQTRILLKRRAHKPRDEHKTHPQSRGHMRSGA